MKFQDIKLKLQSHIGTRDVLIITYRNDEIGLEMQSILPVEDIELNSVTRTIRLDNDDREFTDLQSLKKVLIESGKIEADA